MNISPHLFTICLLVLPFTSTCIAAAGAISPRETIPLTSWDFVEDPVTNTTAIRPPETSEWQQVAVPHVFRQSGLPDNSAGWYRQTIALTKADRGRRVYLVLEGAASVKDVFVNGVFIGRHKGAFSASAFDLTEALKIGQANILAVRVGNREDEARNCFSRSGLYYVNGGMFRKAWLVKTGAVHIFPDMGSSGVYLTPGAITSTGADLHALTVVRNPLATPVEVVVRHFVTDPANKACARFETKQRIDAGVTARIEATGKIPEPQLWDIGRPELYTVRTEIVTGGQVSDAVTERVGLRTIAVRDRRFFLNGREVQFRGVNKHAQNEYEWNAVSDEELRREWQWMANLGVNLVRLPHYPHSHMEYDIADERGLPVWAENGYAGQMWKEAGNDEKTITPDGERLTREMVRQNWNHPSILFWSAGNETIVDVVSHYAAVIRQEADPARLVTYAASDKEPQNCDFVAYNTYDGWYTSGPYTDFAGLPRNAIVSETGSGDWITHHVPYGTIQWSVDKYEPEEYSEMFTEYRLQTVCRDDVTNRPMFLWWNFREFYNLKFKNNRNTKGLVTLAGMPKDIYFLFQAFLNHEQPVVHLCGRNHFLRGFAPDNGIKAYSSADQLQMILNGVPQQKIKNGSYRIPDAGMKKRDGTVLPVPGIPVANVFFWKAPLRPGRNVVEVSDGQGHSDRMVIYQKPAGAPDPNSLVQELQSSNPENPACFIDRPVESQGPFYSDVDGASDNTFDILPGEVEGAGWIATRRLSDPRLKTDLEFRVRGKGNVFVLFSTGAYPIVTLKQSDPEMASAAEVLRKTLTAAGFKAARTDAIWRDHLLNRACAELWRRDVGAGESVKLPGQTLDYVVMVRG
ncbi:MAG TPA: glycoside hydrolase family 2 TIM barrel-domain containing protein, partial [Verrucomicrobiae bacterium]|nr:glycoside hydrolase family 2 TIM barrel-domain containing protein [Verrucomicrobiae bacterium]